MSYRKYHKTAEVARLPRAVVAACVGAVMVAFAFLTYTPPQLSSKAAPLFKPAAEAALASPAKTSDKPLRVVYRNSVVPGGVHSAAEVAAVMARDPVVAAHYAHINVGALRLVRVEKSRLVHVSYRIGNQIFWTKNTVRLTLGEMLLSDGEHLIRARCGNLLADSAQSPILLNEPPAEVLDTAFVSADELIDQEVHPVIMAGVAAPGPEASSPVDPVSPNRLASAGGAFRQPERNVFALPAFYTGATPLATIQTTLPLVPLAIPVAAGPAAVAAHAAPALLVESVAGAPSVSGDTGNVSNEAPVDATVSFLGKADFGTGLPVFPASGGGVTKAASVPEPSGMLLSIVALAGLWRLRRKSRKG